MEWLHFSTGSQAPPLAIVASAATGVGCDVDVALAASVCSPANGWGFGSTTPLTDVASAMTAVGCDVDIATAASVCLPANGWALGSISLGVVEEAEASFVTRHNVTAVNTSTLILAAGIDDTCCPS